MHQQQKQIHQVACIAILGKTDELIYYKSYMTQCVDTKLLKFQVFLALDIIDQIVKKKLLEPTENDSIPYQQYSLPCLGLLYSIGLPENDYEVHGFATTTKCKIIVILQQKRSLEKTNVSTLCTTLHKFYVAMQASVLQASSWDSQIDSLIREFQLNKLN